MKHRELTWITTLAALFAVLAIGAPVGAQDHPAKHKHYTLVDLGIFGGPIGPQGTVVGGASTFVPDPNCLFIWNDANCDYVHAFKWRDGVLTDLGTLPGGNNSLAFSINAQGAIFGASENGLPDPVYGVQAFVTAIWKNGEVHELPTLGGGLSWPGAGSLSINDRGQAVGASMNTIPDPDGYGTALIFPGTVVPGNHWHAVMWQNGTVQDLGTLGDGLDSGAGFVNERGQVAGNSWTDSVPTVFGIPTVHPFFWDNGQMVDLGSLGGVLAYATGLNKKGHVVGFSTLTGDPDGGHAFLWADGAMQDLGVLGGSFSFSEANAINDKGEIAGHSITADEAIRGFRWEGGVMTDLGSVPGFDCSNTGKINASGQIAGWAYHCDDPDGLEHAVLWEKDGPGIDLNIFVPPGSDLELIEADWINDRGEIVGQAFLPAGELHNFLLIPGKEDAAEDAASATATGPNAAPAVRATSVTHAKLTPERLAALKAQFAKRHRGFGLRPPKKAN